MTVQPERGIVLAATGDVYINLARRAARNLRQVMGDVPIDLFTDAPIDDDVFDQIIQLERSTHRPKIEALRLSRFDATLYLDCDVIAIAPVFDIFELLGSYEFVAAHENYRNGRNVDRSDVIDIPAAFPEFNSGVVGLRKTAKTAALLGEWDTLVHSARAEWDQPPLRRLLYESDVRIGVLPHDYNLMHTAFIRHMGKFMTAPRLLHLPTLHSADTPLGDPETPFQLSHYLPLAVVEKLNDMIAADRTLAKTRVPVLPRDLPKPVPPRLLRRIKLLFGLR